MVVGCSEIPKVDQVGLLQGGRDGDDPAAYRDTQLLPDADDGGGVAGLLRVEVFQTGSRRRCDGGGGATNLLTGGAEDGGEYAAGRDRDEQDQSEGSGGGVDDHSSHSSPSTVDAGRSAMRTRRWCPGWRHT